jgi:hypothetical protein
MKGYNEIADAKRLVEQYGPEVAQEIIASYMRDRGMQEGVDMLAGVDVRKAQRSLKPADLSDGMAGAPQSAVGDDAGLAGPYPGAGRPGYDRTFTNEELLAQRGARGDPQDPAGYTAPGPRTLDGRPPQAPQPLGTAEDVEAYTRRQRDPRGPFYNPSPKDFDMGARGMMPVLNPDGTVGYSVAYPGEAPGAPGPQMTGAAGRLGLRPDLESKGWVATPADSPLGLVNVYRPGEDAQKRYDAQAEQRSRRRIAESAGLSGAEAQSMTMDALRSRASAARIDDANARREAWKAQAMLAGGQPTGGRGGSKAITNALMMLPEDERNQSLRYMLPGGDRAAAVDAANAATAGRMAQSAMSAFLTNNPMATPEQRAMFEQRAREANPAAAGAQDVAAGKPETPEGQAELRRLAESMDTGTFGVNTGDSSSMADALMKPPYNLRRPEAEELAYRYMNRRSWFGIGRPGADGSTPPTGVGPTPNPINPRVPLAAPSRPPGV